MRKPRALHPGDQVRVVSPASPLKPEQIENGVRFLEAQGYAVSIAEHALDSDGYLAGSDDDRARDLQDAFEDPDVHCVFCSRGGYGCARLLTRLDIDEMARSGKMFCGFSDVTTLHLALNHAGLATFHTPMLISLSVEREGWVYDSLAGLLAGESSVPSGAPTGETLVPGTAEGVLTGGCLSLLADSKSVIAHCPLANSFLRSGTMDRIKLRSAGVRMALGSDIGAGYETSMVRVGRALGLQTHWRRWARSY